VNPLPGGWAALDSWTVLGLAGIVVALLMIIPLAAAFYLHWRNGHRAALWASREKRWSPALMGYLFEEEPEDSIRSLVGPDEEVPFVEHVLKLSRNLRGEERERLDRLATSYLRPMVERCDHRDPEQRAKAVSILGELGMPQYRGELMVALEDRVPYVAFTAAKALLNNEPGQSVAAILGNLHRFEESSPFYLAGLLASAGIDTAPTLRDYLSTEQNGEELRAIAARALRIIRDPEAAELAAGILEGKPGLELSMACLEILAGVGRPEQAAAIRALFPLENAELLAKALAALGQIGGSEEDRVLIAGSLRHRSAWVALAAARALRDMGERDTLEEYWKGGERHHDLAGEILEEAAS